MSTTVKPFAPNGLSAEISASDMTKTEQWREKQYLALILANVSLGAAASAAETAGLVPTPAQKTATAVVSIIATSPAARIVSVYNNGPDPVTILEGGVAPVASTKGRVLAQGDEWYSAVRITGDVQAICAATKTATLTVVQTQ